MADLSTSRTANPEVAYLGPAGTFTESAVDLMTTIARPIKKPMDSVMDVISSIESGASEYGVVPIENSVEGEVTSTLDYLIFNTESVLIQEEAVVPVTFNAFRRAEFAGNPITTVASHPHALAQCKNFIQENGLAVMHTASTAAACQLVATTSDKGLVALGSPNAGPLYQIEVVAEKVEDNSDARTRFILLGRELFSEREHTKSTFVVSVPNTGVGILARCLTAFADRGISLNSISSRPLRSSLGTYAFVLNLQGHIFDSALQSAINELLDFGVAVKFLGSYREWTGKGVTAPFESRPLGSIDLTTPASNIFRQYLEKR